MQIQRRNGVDPKDGIRNHGDVEFADSVNNKYPIDTPAHVRAAWARVHIPRNAMFYTTAELELITRRIVHAAKRLGVELSAEVVERDAKLFTAGDYPDRGIAVTESDLDRMVESQTPVPIKIEHTDTPLDLGTVTRIWRAGKDLFGKLAFTAPAWALVDACGAKKLSAAIKRDKSGITEVSLVRAPRVAGAAVFSGDIVEFEFTLEGGDDMSETKAAEFSKRIEDLERQLRASEVESHVDSLKRAGKLVPAAEELAKVILSSGESQVVTFSDGTEKPVAEAFLAFLEAQPKVIEFSELAEGAKEAAEMTDSEREFYAKLGVSAKSVVKQRDR